jgi:RNA polymerase sigma factor (TIGR02999 family)
MMRRILVDHSRHRASARRGGNLVILPLDGVEIPAAGRDVDLLALDQALDQLAELDLEKAELVEMRFFGGLTVEELATLRQSSVATVHRQLRSARAWLHRQLGGGRPQPEA